MPFEKHLHEAHAHAFALAAALPPATLATVRCCLDQALQAGLGVAGFRQLLMRQGALP